MLRLVGQVKVYAEKIGGEGKENNGKKGRDCGAGLVVVIKSCSPSK